MTGPEAALATNDIRPDEFMDEQRDLFASDVARLVAHAADFVVVDCPACGSDRRTPTYEKMGISYVLCGRCQTMYTSPRPLPEHLDEYYRTSENYAYWARVIFPASEGTRRERIFEPRVDALVELCERHGVARDDLIEIGPGFGTFGQAVTERGVFGRVRAIEPTPDLAEACRSRGVEVIESRVEDVDLTRLGGTDVLAAFEVLEHLFDPRGFLASCRDLLRPGGLVVLTCPSGQGFEVGTLGPLSTTVDAEHLNYFNPRSIADLLESVGLEVIEVSTPGRLDADMVRTAVLDGSISVDHDPFLQAVLIDQWEELGGPFQQFLARSSQSSHLWAVAQRAS